MKRIIILITVAIYCLSSSYIMAQALEEVTLTVSSDGPTKDEATKNALRSAIEQAYGTFVSANTTILNDELVKDEIVTVSNGSIKDYKELACTPTQNGGQYVTLQATVSLPQLIKYSRSKGSECEFAGNTFAMEMKLWELNKESELKALQNLRTVLGEMRDVCDYDMVISEPTAKDNNIEISGSIFPLANTNTQLFFQQLFSTLEALHAFEDESVENTVGYKKVYHVNILRKPDNHYFSVFLRNPDSKKILHEIFTHYLNCIDNGFQICDNISSPSSAAIKFLDGREDIEVGNGFTKKKHAKDWNKNNPFISQPERKDFIEEFNRIKCKNVQHEIEKIKNIGKKKNKLVYVFPYFNPVQKFYNMTCVPIFNLEWDDNKYVYKTTAADPINFIMTIPSTEISKYNNFKIEKTLSL
ncbi:MAG: hypothetical protein NC212_01265 [Staphylococcus sp.]|nr:hypothetical protein [Staphylococcus sp.]